MKLSAALLLAQAATFHLATALKEPTDNQTQRRYAKSTKVTKGGKDPDDPPGTDDAEEPPMPPADPRPYFKRTSNFFMCSQQGASCGSDATTSAEIVAATDDGMTLVYTDAERGGVGRVDISDPSNPLGTGFFAVDGEPTSVAIHGDYAVVVVNTSAGYVDVSGELHVFSIADWKLLKTFQLGGQPDSVAWSADGKYVVVAIENERDEDLGDGGLPQMPPGFVVVFDTMNAAPASWTQTNVAVTGLPGVLYPEDPEPEFVSINSENVAVITLQENNAVVLIDLATKGIVSSFSTGQVDLTHVDIEEEGIITQVHPLTRLREPDGVAWVDSQHFITANEGDMDGGSRGFTVFHKYGAVIYESGSELEHIAASLGHYPEERSENKGNEPENVAVGVLDGKPVAFIVSERSSVIFVYDMSDVTSPELVQVLPCGLGPEGAKYISSRGLLVAAAEVDDRSINARGVISIFDIATSEKPVYPYMMAAPGIAWGASSGLSFGSDTNTLYTIEDSFYGKSRIFRMNTESHPLVIEEAIRIMDTNGVLEAAAPGFFVNADKTVNLDPEGVTLDSKGMLWVASEGKGSAGDGSAPNVLVQLNMLGVIQKAVLLPPEIAAKKLKWGLEGVAFMDDGSDDGLLVACLQRPWQGETHPMVLAWSITDNAWAGYFRYPLDEVESPAGGWIGLSEVSVHAGMIYILERDNQGGPDARVKKVYKVDPMTLNWNGEVAEKEIVYDILPVLETVSQGLTPEKVEGMAVTNNGMYINNDNDGVDDYNGATYVSFIPMII